MQAEPKVFVSYSWTSKAHQDWVVSFAEQLQLNGVETILDLWELSEGDDVNAFMERVVTDPAVSHVLIVCDKGYMERANARKGGVGAESRVISHALYSKTTQDKFIPVVRELDDDGAPTLPAYLSGRFYADFSNDHEHPAAFQRLMRTLFGVPERPKPSLGKPPAFLATAAATQSRLQLKAAMAPTTFARPVANRTAWGSFLSEIGVLLNETRLPHITDAVDYHSEFMKGLSQHESTTAEFSGALLEQAVADSEDCSWVVPLHAFFEAGLALHFRPPDAPSWQKSRSELSKFLLHEMLLNTIAVCINTDSFRAVDFLFSEPFFYEDSGKRTSDISIFDVYLGALNDSSNQIHKGAGRNQRLSPHVDLLKERAERSTGSFEDLMQADLIAFLRIALNAPESRPAWFPRTLVFAGWRHEPFDLFYRAAHSSRHFSRLSKILGSKSPSDFINTVETARTNQRWADHRMGHIGFDYPRWLNLAEFKT